MQTKLFRTFGFRIALLYLALLSLTLLSLVVFVYWSTAKLIDRQIDETVEAEIRGLAEQYRDEGLPRLIDVIAERSGPLGDPKSVYLLTNSMLEPLAGNLEAWPGERVGPDGWLDTRLGRSGEDPVVPHSVRGRRFDLAGGYHLFIGRDMQERAGFRIIMVEGLGWAVAPALLLGLAGAGLIGRYSLRRVEAVRVTSEDIVLGDLSRRVPLTGSGDEFDRLAVTINVMLDQIDSLMTGMRAVTDSLAHDLRGPLTHAKSGIELTLRRDSDIGAYRQTLEQTNLELETILRTFESLIRIAHAEAGINRLTFELVDLASVVNGLVEVYQPSAEDAGLCLIAEISPTVLIEAHRQLLAQAIANLLDNAIKYTPSGGRIGVSLVRERGAPVLTVRDSGPGIPAEHRDRVLQRFVRLDDSRGTPGSGLGLSLVAAVAKLHGARLELGDGAPGLVVVLRFASQFLPPAR